jgi:hypothetical protein
MNTTAQSYTTPERKVLDVFNRHVAASTSGDLDAVLNDFGERSVVITPDGEFEGLAHAEQSGQRKINRHGGAS